MTQLAAKRVPWRIIVACLILISGAAIMITTTPYSELIQSGLQYTQAAIHKLPDVADSYQKAKALRELGHDIWKSVLRHRSRCGVREARGFVLSAERCSISGRT
jgi:hypothetical protein